MLKNWLEKRKAIFEAKQKAKEGFISWLDISKSAGWQTYKDAIEKKIDNIKTRLETDVTLTGEDLKKLQLALQVYREVQRIPKDLEAKGR